MGTDQEASESDGARSEERGTPVDAGDVGAALDPL